MGDTTKEDVIALGGHEFRRVKNGLDEAQVTAFITELISERDKIAQSQDHLASLSRLAEKTVAEADRLAEQIKTEAAEQAKVESAAIINKAKEQAQQIEEEKIAEATKIANEKAEAIQVEAKKKVALLLENGRKKIQDELGNLVNQQFGHLRQELESFKQQALAAQAKFEHKLSQRKEESSSITVESKKENDAATVKEGKGLEESVELIQATDQSDGSLELSQLLQIKNQVELGEPQCEVEVLPPVDIGKIMKIVAYLDQLPEVENTEIIPRRIDRPSIVVFLREPMNLVDVLGTIPEVAYVEQVTKDEDAANGGPEKVQIGLLGNTAPQEEK